MGLEPVAAATLRREFEQRRPRMVEELGALVAIESPSSAPDALAACASFLDTVGSNLLGKAAERIETGPVTNLLWRFGDRPKVVLIGHYDTVHPKGTIHHFPFSVDGDIVRGPGVYDMKGGLVTAMHALDVLRMAGGDALLDGVWFFVNADEEVGSPHSRSALQEVLVTRPPALVLEGAGPRGELKIARKGRLVITLHAEGRASHAGADPEKGVNAIGELASQYDAVLALERPELGTTVVPTVIETANADNVVPAMARLVADARMLTTDELARLGEELKGFTAARQGTRLRVETTIDHQPMPPSASAELFELATAAGRELGMGDIGGIVAGGSSDANNAAECGCRSIDGFGPMGGDDHSPDEWMDVNSMLRQSALLANTIAKVLGFQLVESGPAQELRAAQ